MNSLLMTDVAGNTLASWLGAATIAVVTATIILVARRVLASRLAAIAGRTPGLFDDALLAALAALRPWFAVLISVYTGSLLLSMPDSADTIVRRLAILACLVQAGLSCHRALAIWLTGQVQGKAGAGAGAANPATASITGFVARLVLWSLVLMMALDNLGINVTTLVAGLGVGGIAVALAMQNILGDIFSSLAIALDEPVLLGDFVVIGDLMGTVERVGIKTTRLRSLSGEQIVLANSDLLSSRIRNYKRMYERRIQFQFGVTYDTSADNLDRIPGIVRSIIDGQARSRFDRAHFGRFGDSALEFEVVYFVLDPDYNVYMDIQQRINMELVRQFRTARIEFAFPTQTVHIASPATSPTCLNRDSQAA